MNRTVTIHLQWQDEDIIIPELASRIEITQGEPPHIHGIISKGHVTAPSPRGVKVISLHDAQFWEGWINRHIEPAWTPRQYVDKLNEIRDSMKPARLVIESELPNYCHNMLVLIDFESWYVDAVDEKDIHYSLVMYEHDPDDLQMLEIGTDSDANGSQVTTVYPPEPYRADERPPPPETYTVVGGDSLIRIARRFGQPDSAWRDLYLLNQAEIHSRGNQNLIFPGQVFKIPDGWAKGAPVPPTTQLSPPAPVPPPVGTMQRWPYDTFQ